MDRGRERRRVMYASLAFAYPDRFHSSEIPVYSHEDIAAVQGSSFSQTPDASSLTVYLIIQQEEATGQTSVVGWI